MRWNSRDKHDVVWLSSDDEYDFLDESDNDNASVGSVLRQPSNVKLESCTPSSLEQDEQHQSPMPVYVPPAPSNTEEARYVENAQK